MVDSDLILQWKAQYKDLYEVVVGGVVYIFRALTFREYDNLTSGAIEIPDLEELVIALAVLYPEELDPRIKPGFITSIAEEIIDVSGFTDINSARSILERKRQEAQSFRFNMKAFVLATQPNVNDELLDDLTFAQLAEKVAMAERIIAIQQAVMGRQETGIQLEIVDPAEEEAMDQASQQEAFKDLSHKNPYESSMPGAAVKGDPIAEKLKAALR